MTILLSNREIYEQVICGVVPQAKERLWIATADIKDMYVDAIAAERSEGRAKRGDSRGVSRVRGEGCATDGKAIVGIASATARCVELRLERAANPCRACPYTLREGPSPPPLLPGRIPGFPDEAALPPARRSAEVSVTTRNEEIKNDIGSPIRKDVQWRSCHPRPCGNAPSAHWRCDRLRQVGNCMNLRGEDDEPVTSIACARGGRLSATLADGIGRDQEEDRIRTLGFRRLRTSSLLPDGAWRCGCHSRSGRSGLSSTRIQMAKRRRSPILLTGRRLGPTSKQFDCNLNTVSNKR